MEIFSFTGKELETQEKSYVTLSDFSTTVTHRAYTIFEVMTEFMFTSYVTKFQS